MQNQDPTITHRTIDELMRGAEQIDVELDAAAREELSRLADEECARQAQAWSHLASKIVGHEDE